MNNIQTLVQQIIDAKNEYNDYFQRTYSQRNKETEIQCEIMLAKIVALQYDLNTAVNSTNEKNVPDIQVMKDMQDMKDMKDMQGQESTGPKRKVKSKE